MNPAKSRKHLIYTLISFACPVIAFLMVIAYQSVAHAHDWEGIAQDSDSGAAGALLMFAEIVQIVFAVLFGSIIGLIFAVLGIRQRRILGLAALIFNGLPFVALLILMMSRGI